MKKSLYYFFINILFTFFIVCFIVAYRMTCFIYCITIHTLSQVCAVCAPSCVNVWRPVEQIVGVQSRNCNHVSATKRNHKSSRRRLRPSFSHTTAVVRVCIHAICTSSCAKYRLASNCRSAILTSRSVSCHYF